MNDLIFKNGRGYSSEMNMQTVIIFGVNVVSRKNVFLFKRRLCGFDKIRLSR